MAVTVKTKTCAARWCTNTFVVKDVPGRPRKYCIDDPDCVRKRNAERKELERAIVENTFWRVIAPEHVEWFLIEPPKRKRSGHTDSDSPSKGEFDWGDAGGGTEWQAIERAWNPCHSAYNEGGGWRVLPACRGPETNPKIRLVDPAATVQWSDVDKLMGEAERRANKRGFGQKLPTVIRRFSGKNEDRWCAGELWLRGKHEAAERRARRDTTYAEYLAERDDDAGGPMWDAIRYEPKRRAKRVWPKPKPRPEPIPREDVVWRAPLAEVVSLDELRESERDLEEAA